MDFLRTSSDQINFFMASVSKNCGKYPIHLTRERESESKHQIWLTTISICRFKILFKKKTIFFFTFLKKKKRCKNAKNSLS